MRVQTREMTAAGDVAETGCAQQFLQAFAVSPPSVGDGDRAIRARGSRGGSLWPGTTQPSRLHVAGQCATAGDQYRSALGKRMVSTEDVKAAYRLILGRPPESGDVLFRHARQYRSIDELREAFFNSPEFQNIP